METFTTINSNGSKWAGSAPDNLGTLLSVLEVEPLDRTFEEFGNFHYPSENDPKVIHFFGNFFCLSHVFNIDSNDPEVIRVLRLALQTNQKRPDYLAQETPEERKAEENRIYQIKIVEIQAKRERDARQVLGILR